LFSLERSGICSKNALGDGLGILAALGRLDGSILGIFCSKINSKADYSKRFLLQSIQKVVNTDHSHIKTYRSLHDLWQRKPILIR
jgi:hypothetical protein